MSFKTRLIGGASALALAGGMMAFVAPAANAATQTLLDCGTTTHLFASLNPTLGSGDAKVTKAVSKRNNGALNHLSLTGSQDLGPSTTDATSCAVDAGIRTDNPLTNKGAVLNPYDNQTNGQATLSMGAINSTATITGISAGSASCNRADPTLVTTYPRSYPLNGLITYKYLQLTAASVAIQNQFYVRLGADATDPDATHITVKGIAIKGPGVGGDVSATFAFGAAFAPTKNLNLTDCLANPALKNASLGSLLINAADGSDAGTLDDPFLVTIPA